MLQYIVRRLLWAVVMLILVQAIVFTIFFVLPGGSGKSRAGHLHQSRCRSDGGA